MVKIPEWQAAAWKNAERRQRKFWNLFWTGIAMWSCAAGPLALIIMFAYGRLRSLLHWEPTFFLFTDLGVFFLAHQLSLLVFISYFGVDEERSREEPPAHNGRRARLGSAICQPRALALRKGLDDDMS
jgi:hypothetical protein